MNGKPRYGAPRDANQSEICKALNAIPNVEAVDTGAAGDGFPDLVVGHNRINYLFEVKPELVKGKVFKSKTSLNEKQVEFHDNWPGQVDVIRTLDDALEIMGLF